MNDLQGFDHALELAFDGDHALHVHAHVIDAGDGDTGLGLLLYCVDDVALLADDATDVVIVG